MELIDEIKDGSLKRSSCRAYVTNAVFDDWLGRRLTELKERAYEHFDDRPAPLRVEQIGITPPESAKRPGLFLEYMDDRIKVCPAAIDPVCEWVVAQIFPSYNSSMHFSKAVFERFSK